jgi:hypothetical protein
MSRESSTDRRCGSLQAGGYPIVPAPICSQFQQPPIIALCPWHVHSLWRQGAMLQSGAYTDLTGEGICELGHLKAALSLIPLQLPLAPMRLFPVSELADMPVQRLHEAESPASGSRGPQSAWIRLPTTNGALPRRKVVSCTASCLIVLEEHTETQFGTLHEYNSEVESKRSKF